MTIWTTLDTPSLARVIILFELTQLTLVSYIVTTWGMCCDSLYGAIFLRLCYI